MTTPTIYEQFKTELEREGYSHETIVGYVKIVRDLVWHYQRLPDQLTGEEIREYVLHVLQHRKYVRKTMVGLVSALRAFFHYVLHRSKAEIDNLVPTLKIPPAPPQIYTTEEIERLLNAKGLRMRHRMMLMTTYAAGLHESELCNLKVEDILSSQMRLRIRKTKSKDEHFTPLSPALLEALRDYWRIYRPFTWLFPATGNPTKRLDRDTAYRIFQRAIETTGLPKKGSIHSLRHSFAAHMIEAGLDLPTLQRFLGYKWIAPVLIYSQIARPRPGEFRSPLNLIQLGDVPYESRAATDIDPKFS